MIFSTSILLADLPQAVGKKLPCYLIVPAIRMGRLAVAQDSKGLGLGGSLLADTLARVCSAEIAAYPLAVDSKDKPAADFYLHHGLVAFAAALQKLFLPLARVKAQIQAAQEGRRRVAASALKNTQRSCFWISLQ